MVKLEEEEEEGLEGVGDAGGMHLQLLGIKLRVQKAMSEEGDSTGGGGSETVTDEGLFGMPSEGGSPGGGESETVTAELFPC